MSGEGTHCSMAWNKGITPLNVVIKARNYHILRTYYHILAFLCQPLYQKPLSFLRSLLPFHHLNLLLRQPIELIHPPICCHDLRFHRNVLSSIAPPPFCNSLPTHPFLAHLKMHFSIWQEKPDLT